MNQNPITKTKSTLTPNRNSSDVPLETQKQNKQSTEEQNQQSPSKKPARSGDKQEEE